MNWRQAFEVTNDIVENGEETYWVSVRTDEPERDLGHQTEVKVRKDLQRVLGKDAKRVVVMDSSLYDMRPSGHGWKIATMWVTLQGPRELLLKFFHVEMDTLFKDEYLVPATEIDPQTQGGA